MDQHTNQWTDRMTDQWTDIPTNGPTERRPLDLLLIHAFLVLFLFSSHEADFSFLLSSLYLSLPLLLFLIQISAISWLCQPEIAMSTFE